MRSVIMGIALLLVGFAAQAKTTIDFSYKDAEITKVIADYSKASGTKWIVDPFVRGKITILNPDNVMVEEAFNQLSTALAINGLSYTEDNGTYKVMQSRQIQRSNIPVVKEVPPLKPERMMTWIVTLKHVPSQQIMNQVRTLSSKDGEVASLADTNQMIFSDYSSNLNRIAQVIAELDKPADPQRAKLVSANKAIQEKSDRARRERPQNRQNSGD